jgi:uncharacterized delta-60 repeat protein
VDAAGDVVAAGFTQNTLFFTDFTIIKFDGASGAELWRQVINGTAIGHGEAFAVTVDASGDVVATGFTWNTSTGGDFTAVKLDSATGGELWRRVINGRFLIGEDKAFAVRVDGGGNVVAAGVTENTGSGFGDFIVVKFDGASGAELWRQVIDGTLPANFSDVALAVTVDGDGNVVAAGVTQNMGTGNDFTVVKFDGANGAELWRRAINGTANDSDQALAVAVDGVGDVVAAGITVNTGTGRDFTVIKLDGASGQELWRQVINGTWPFSFDQANAVRVDAGGNVIAAGLTTNTGADEDFTVVKISGVSGAELWRQVISGTAGFSVDQAFAVTVDADENVVATGRTENTGTSTDFTVIKFDGASGAELWRQVINGTANFFDEARAVTVDAAGDVVAAGFTTNSSTLFDFTVIKLDGTSGAELWRQIINGTDGLNDRASAVAVDAAGDVVAGGFTFNSDPLVDFTVVKLDGASGAELWRQVINGTVTSASFDEARAVKVDAAGDVVAAGVTENTGTQLDFIVVKFDGMSGGEVWRRVINGTANIIDLANALAVDDEGNVVAAGSTWNTGTGTDFTVIKLRGTDGGDF